MKHSLICICLILLFSCKKKEQKAAQGETRIVPADFLVAANYRNLYVDFVYEAGLAPSAETVTQLRDFLNNRMNKPGGIQLVLKEINGTGKDKLSMEEVKALERKHRSYYSNGTFLSVFVLFANSDYSNNNGAKTLGIHYGPTSLVLFAKTIRSYAGGFGKPSAATLETAVAEHEFGHVMGLVDHGTPMVTNHLDAAHGKHCNNSSCLMYYMTETSDIVGNLLGASVPPLDQNCLNDLKSNGGK